MRGFLINYNSEDIKERCERTAEYIIENSATVRSAAKHFGISKSTVHKDVTERLKGINNALFTEAEAVLLKNKAERHIRGGQATKEKYMKLKERDGTL